MESILVSILHRMEVALLVRNSDGKYEFYGECPDFYKALFPRKDGNPTNEPWKYSLMLDFFYNNAEHFFLTEKNGSISSGVWQEDRMTGDDLLLIAYAMHIEGKHILSIRNLSSDFPNHIAMLQKARENLLQQKKLSKTLDFYKKKSSYDELTALYNRGAFIEIVKAELNQESVFGINAAILMVDIDKFKNINDTYGHLEGDKVLKELGNLFVETLRNNDIAARYGGEEFIVFAYNTNEIQAGRLGEKIRTTVENHRFGELPRITVSVGASIFRYGETLEDCIDRADKALYEAKNAGRNKVKVI